MQQNDLLPIRRERGKQRPRQPSAAGQCRKDNQDEKLSHFRSSLDEEAGTEVSRWSLAVCWQGARIRSSPP